jgi:hypothetical protein
MVFKRIVHAVKSLKRICLLFCVCALLATCTSDPFTGKKNVALAGDSDLFPEFFTQYQEFPDQSVIIHERDDVEVVKRVRDRIKAAAEQWGVPLGQPDYLKDYQWERHLTQSGELNTWSKPGGKIVVYTGILPIMQNADEIDYCGLILMTTTGYVPKEAVAFWERMSALGGGTLGFPIARSLDERRIANSKGWIPEARVATAATVAKLTSNCA